MLDLESLIRKFFRDLKENKEGIEIYNEFSFQHELGIFLREELKGKGYKIQFERNVKDFDYEPKEKNEKKEIDIVVLNTSNDDEKYAIELKFANQTNGQYPEKMFSFIKDISFMEKVQTKCKGFIQNYCVTFVENKRFYTGHRVDGIYAYFRNGKKISGNIEKPTGENKFDITIQNSYQIKWEDFCEYENESKKFYIVKI